MLKIYNNLTRTKEAFVPMDPKNVRMYVCGMTVYDYCHIGHARVLVVFDIVYRYLKHIYGDTHVNYVRNITDIDDKIIARANENQQSIQTLTQQFIDYMDEDARALGIEKPNKEPRATLYMDQIIAMIQSLVDKKMAYQAKNGDVYYDVSEFPDYGKLSGKNTNDLRAGARVEVETAKDDPLDFVLWKVAKPGEPSWDSPWGKGRPGWHIECSAMSTHCLGNHFDIHGGGLDLQFPHHENEIAQSEASTGEKFANVWIHNGFVRVDDEKMSKSLGNFFTIREVLKIYDWECLRYFILSSHYRSPLNYSDQHLDSAKASLTTLYTALRGIDPIISEDSTVEEDFSERFYKAMGDDFNTSEAVAVLFDIARECNRVKELHPISAQKLAGLLKTLGFVLGILQRDPEEYLQGGVSEQSENQITASQIDQLVAQRTTARESKDWAESDRIRDELMSQGVILEDGTGTTTWRRE